MKEIVIVAAKRSAIGSFGGSLKDISATDLATQVLKATLKDINLAAQEIDEVILGQVLQAGSGQNTARQVAIKAGLNQSVSAFTINKVCGSGLKSVALAYQSILIGDNDLVVAGGVENMSQSPYLLKKARFGYKMGNSELIDSMISDGLWCAINDYHMGQTAENLCKCYDITRQEQDEFALKSQQKALKASQSGRFKDEIIPIEIPDKKGVKIFENDEFIRKDASIESLEKLKPAFAKDGSVTAGNSSGINDGAAIVILCSKEKAQKLGLKPLVSIQGFATAGVDPSIMGIGPIEASKKVLHKTGLNLDQIDLIEANEAFGAQSLAVAKDLNFNPDKLNVNGGAIALGHPIGASGARILVTLIHEMLKRKSVYGLATLCIGGGQGIASIVKSCQS
ncbi:acetyl-CoA acetyltransferase [Helicobacter sp. 12S02232-10]|uniref:acetyl-CoA C-acetyltransferase n=1 Tax=Helicobacter sp. 12S02232-10 TaxID=1476197 RepID=UPI000BA567C0|nr:acetyl-CoA C-acetyltransferase [Helicobacter sp. 12S02232-10]PAF49938.1 acetyl-CoA acetyltransferase [Helicobacter sp. 12S02232-10]